MVKIRIYVSSTSNDFGQVKRRLVQELNDLPLFEVYETPSEASADGVVQRCLSDVETCDVYVGIFGHCYGWIPDDDSRNPHRLSMTELEYRKAEELSKKRLIFLCELSGYDAGCMEHDRDKQNSINRLRKEFEEAKEFSIEKFEFKGRYDLVNTVVKRVFSIDSVTEAFHSNYDENSSPYPGLFSFSYEDRRWYFGREKEINKASEILDGADCNFLMVCGPSGSGKSSLVEAGLLPTLSPSTTARENTNWFVTVRPAAHPSNPLTALAHRLSDRISGRPIPDKLAETWSANPRSLANDLFNLRQPIHVLVIDQMEELFTNFDDIGVRQAFVSAISYARELPNPITGKPLTVLASIRSDYKEECQSIPELNQVLSRSHYIDLFEINDSSVRRMIRSPAELANLNIDEVVDTLVSETSSNNGSLPLLATTLRTLWQRREGHNLKKVELERMGGISGVISEHANAAYDDYEQEVGREEAKKSFHALFSALVRVNMEGLPVRRVASEGEFQRSGAMQLAEKFADERTRLVYFNESPDSGGRGVEVVHEALFSSWKRLSDWIASRKKQEQDLSRSSLSADDWKKNDREISRIDLVKIHDAHRAMKLLGKEPRQLDEVTREYLFPKAYLISRLSQPIEETSVGDRERIGMLLDQVSREWSGEGDLRPGAGIEAHGIPNGDDTYWEEVKPGDIVMLISPTRKERIEVTGGFQLARFPITQSQFKAFLTAKDGYQDRSNWPEIQYIPDPFPFPDYGDNRPAVNVAWIEAMAYCRWLTKQLHEQGKLEKRKVARLPTEQEWQLASEKLLESDGGDYTSSWDYLSAEYGIMAVGLGPDQNNSELSKLDFSSCIWEWCLNQYEEFESIKFDIEKTERAVRGGSFLVTQIKSRERFRGSLNLFGRDVNIGFRVCIANGR